MPILTTWDRLIDRRPPRFASILSIKIDDKGVWYEMSDDRINYQDGESIKQDTRYPGRWVAEKDIRNRYALTELYEPEAANA